MNASVHICKPDCTDSLLRALLGLIEPQNLVVLLGLLIILYGRMYAFGLPRLLIPDEGGFWARFRSGMAVSWLLLSITIGSILAEPGFDQVYKQYSIFAAKPEQLRIEIIETATVGGLFIYFLSICLTTVAPFIGALLRRREERHRRRHLIHSQKRSTFMEDSSDFTHPHGPTQEEAFSFTLGLLPLSTLVFIFDLYLSPFVDKLELLLIPYISIFFITLLGIFLIRYEKRGTLASETLSAFCSCIVLLISLVNLLEIPWLGVLTVLGLFGAISRQNRDPYALKNIWDHSQNGEVSQQKFPLNKIDEQIEDVPLEDSGHHFRSHGKQPLILVCVSGGGTRSAVWTIRTLDALERKCVGLFKPRIIFGASGGMLGATRYVTTLPTKDDAASNQRISAVEKDSLRGLVQKLFTHDIPALLLPWGTRHQEFHRGDTIEESWRHNFQITHDYTFRDLKQHRQHNTHIVYSPMLIEDGRRLLISDLKLPWLTQARGPTITSNNDVQNITHQRFSTSALEFRQCFGDAALDRLSLFTATRLSATFPYIMPISSLPTDPRRRVVDAGYYDNYGTSLAVRWLQWTLADAKRRAWLMTHVSCVLVIQIRDGIIPLTRPLRSLESRPPKGRWAQLWHQAIVLYENLTGPFQALLQFRQAAQLFGNDEQLSEVLGQLNQQSEDSDFAKTISFELGVSASLSWTLSGNEKENIKNATRSEDFETRLTSIFSYLKRKTKVDPLL